MKWSRYNRLFRSQRNGWLLYNSASNSLFQLEDALAEKVKEIADDPEGFDFTPMPQVYFQLRGGGFLVEDGQDDALYNILKMKRLTQRYANRTLLLTVAVTRSCNFDCSYCFEGNRSGRPMTEEVEDKVLAFIGKHKGMEALGITWYGGEPLLAFDRIQSFDKKLKAMGTPYQAHLITNGYLLTEGVIEKLNDLQIKSIQITLDGSQPTHDSRRYLKGGQRGTFQTILSNLDHLMASDYQGTVLIRVNVDSRNEDEFMEVYRLIQRRYPEQSDQTIYVYPGFVQGDEHPDVSCFFDSGEKARFVAKMARQYGVDVLSLFPKRAAGGCTLTSRNAYVVGPEGELYKCWNDVGIPEAVVGHVDRAAGWNMGLIAEGMVACSYLDSPECKECYYFPVCDGGCHKERMKNLHDDLNRDCCSYFKDHLEELLELHYEQKRAARYRDRGRRQRHDGRWLRL